MCSVDVTERALSLIDYGCSAQNWFILGQPSGAGRAACRPMSPGWDPETGSAHHPFHSPGPSLKLCQEKLSLNRGGSPSPCGRGALHVLVLFHRFFYSWGYCCLFLSVARAHSGPKMHIWSHWPFCGCSQMEELNDCPKTCRKNIGAAGIISESSKFLIIGVSTG